MIGKELKMFKWTPKALNWRVYTMSATSGKVALALVGEYGTKREAVNQIPAGARTVVRIGRSYQFVPPGR